MTESQRRLLRVIERYQAENDGASPSFEEMGMAMGIAGKGALYGLLKSLEEHGLITREPNRARRIKVLSSGYNLEVVPTEALLAEISRRSADNGGRTGSAGR